MHKPYMDNRRIEACCIIDAYKKLDLHKPPKTIPGEKDICQYEMIMILTDKAITYYQDEKNQMEIMKKTKGINCAFYKWEENKLELL